jgi:hypothetical protein
MDVLNIIAINIRLKIDNGVLPVEDEDCVSHCQTMSELPFL